MTTDDDAASEMKQVQSSNAPKEGEQTHKCSLVRANFGATWQKFLGCSPKSSSLRREAQAFFSPALP